MTRGHALRSGLHQQAEDFQPVFLGKSGQGRDGVCYFHNSTNIEIMAACQDGFRLDMAAGTFKMIYKGRFRRLSGSAVGPRRAEMKYAAHQGGLEGGLGW